MPSFLVVVVTLTSDPCPSCSTGGVNVPPGGIDDVEPEEQPFVKPKGEAEHMWPVHLLKVTIHFHTLVHSSLSCLRLRAGCALSRSEVFLLYLVKSGTVIVVGSVNSRHVVGSAGHGRHRCVGCEGSISIVRWEQASSTSIETN